MKYHQDAWVYVDMPCIMWITTECKTFKKNEMVKIVSVDDDTFTISNDVDEMEFAIKDFHHKCLVGYATTIHKSQGDTCAGRVNFFDSADLKKWGKNPDGMGETDFRRAIYTALSRATSIDHIKICS